MAPVTERDWYAWHHDYDDPGTALAQRLAAVQEQIRVTLGTAPAGPLRAISLCAGQGRDLIGALAGHPRRHEVRARLVELDPRNAGVARQAARAAGLPQVEVVTGDAALTDAYAGMTPADLVLACGVFGNLTDADIERTVGYCTQLCARGGTVVWTRGRWAPDLLPQICGWFADRGFDELWVSDPAEGWGAAAHRFTGTPDPLEEGARMFTFRGHHPRIGPVRHLSLSTERTVVSAPRPGPKKCPVIQPRAMVVLDEHQSTAPWTRPAEHLGAVRPIAGRP
jgi:Putative methyltransferase